MYRLACFSVEDFDPALAERRGRVEDRARDSYRDLLLMMNPEFEPDVEVLLVRQKAERAR